MKSYLSLILLLLTLAIAIFFRFYKLSEIPPGLYPDVAINGNDAMEALKTGHPVKFLTSFGITGQSFKLFYPENNGREGLFINLIALSFAIFGPSIWAIKIVPAVFGTLTVLGLYLFVHKLFSNTAGHSEAEGRGISRECENFFPDKLKDSSLRFTRLRMTNLRTNEIIALLSAFFLAISFWHVNFSRIGFRAIMVPFFLVWSFYFLFKAINATPIPGLHPDDPDKIPPPPPLLKGGSGRISSANHKLKTAGYWLFAGLLFGLGFHTYIAFRVAPLILVPILVIEFIKYWPRFKSLITKHLSLSSLVKQIYIKDGWFRWDVFFVAIILVALPLAIYYWQNPADFMGRAGQVSVFASENPIKTLAISTAKTLGQFVVWGDANWRHNLSGSPQIFWPLIPFFLIGLFFSIAQIIKKRNYKQENLSLITCHWTLLAWWGVMLLPSILTSEGLPHALRSIGAIPPSFIFVGLGAYMILNYLNSKLQNLKEYLFAYKFVASGLIVMALLAVATLEYSRYFISWGQNPETEGAFTKKFIDEANYLNSLPQNVQKYVIVNEDGVAVPWPQGIPMPAQTIKFLTKIHQPETEIQYIKLEGIYQLTITNYQLPVVILPMQYEQNIFSQLRRYSPDGKIEIREKEGFAVFKINF